jgi:uncharacterized membrane protein SpoIIM required for sporulation
MLGWYRRLPPRVQGWVPYVAVAALTMVLMGILGFAVGVQSPPSSSLPIRSPGAGPADLTTVGLFAHNAEIAIRSALGILSVGIYTTVVLLVNGFMLGAGIADIAEVYGLGSTLLALAPHGVLEIPAIWLSGAIGLRWLRYVWKVANSDRDRIAGPWLALESLALTGLALLMLFVAAAIEANVSVHLI